MELIDIEIIPEPKNTFYVDEEYNDDYNDEEDEDYSCYC